MKLATVPPSCISRGFSGTLVRGGGTDIRRTGSGGGVRRGVMGGSSLTACGARLSATPCFKFAAVLTPGKGERTAGTATSRAFFTRFSRSSTRCCRVAHLLSTKTQITHGPTRITAATIKPITIPPPIMSYLQVTSLWMGSFSHRHHRSTATLKWTCGR